MTNFEYDAIVVGGGVAGLAATMVLARARRRVLLIDAGRQNNLRTSHAGGVFLHDGEAPSALYARAREQLAAYPTIEYHEGLVADAEAVAEADGGGFRVDGVTTRTLVLAQGVEFAPSAIPGADELWGSLVVHCPFCDGYESRDQRVLVTGSDDYLAHMRAMLPLWVDDLTFAPQSEVVRFGRDADSGRLRVTFDDGRTEQFGRAFVQQPFTQRTGLADRLGCARIDAGPLTIDAMGQTTVPGVFAAGDQTAMAMAVNLAVGAGHLAGVGAVFALMQH